MLNQVRNTRITKMTRYKKLEKKLVFYKLMLAYVIATIIVMPLGFYIGFYISKFI